MIKLWIIKIIIVDYLIKLFLYFNHGMNILKFIMMIRFQTGHALLI